MRQEGWQGWVGRLWICGGLAGAGWVGHPAPLASQGLRGHLVDLFTVGGQAVPFRVAALRDPAAPAAGVVPDESQARPS